MDKEYNAAMCCRIYRSHPLTRVVKGLYIFLATFLIGFFAVQAVLWIDSNHIPSYSALFSLESNADRDTDLFVWHERTRAISDTSVISIYRVTNASSRRIYFKVDKETYKMPAFVSVSSDLITETSIEVTNRELGPGESGELWITLPKHALDVTFGYKFEDHDSSQAMTINIIR